MALASYNDIGYVQGLNFIAAVVLVTLSMNEQQTLRVLVSLLVHHKFQAVLEFKPGGVFRQLCFQLEALCFIY